jgi:hypothetical protein
MVHPDDFDAAGVVTQTDALEAVSEDGVGVALSSPPNQSRPLEILPWVLALTTLICGIGWITSAFDSNNELSTLKQQLTSVRSAQSDDQQKLGALETELKTFRLNRLDLAEKWPLVMATVKLTNTVDGRDLGNAGVDRFRSTAARYICFDISGPNLFFGMQAFSGTVGVKYVQPDGSILRNAQSSPPDLTMSLPVSAAISDRMWHATSCWGNHDVGAYNTGLWRVCFLHSGKLIVESSFEIFR